jgi:putative tryptophan/tyrosine transport system substrate-binding protein
MRGLLSNGAGEVCAGCQREAAGCRDRAADVRAGRQSTARGRHTKLPLVGFLSPVTQPADNLTAFRQALRDGGIIEGQNVEIEYRIAEGQYDRLPALAADLVRHAADVTFAASPPAALAAKAATTTIPIVFISGEDPVQIGLVTSFNRPGGNLTGVGLLSTEVTAKRLGLLRQLIPQAGPVAVLANPANSEIETTTRDVEEAARQLGLKILFVNARSDHDIELGFAAAREERAVTLLVGVDPFFTSRGDQLIALAARYSIPTMYYLREFVAAGGLISYGTRISDAYRQVGVYVARILKGTKPSDLPVVRPTKFDFVINLKTAKALGLTIPETLLATADEVIQS